jgi:leucyl/phenylalanyl-tRNA--protein transferase
MPLWLLSDDSPDFPPASEAASDPDGLLALGGDYSVPRLLAAYRAGIFPWSVWRGRITWHSPDPRFVLLRENFRIPHTLRRILKKNPYRITVDRAFPKVIAACARAPRPDGESSWISPDLRRGYTALHRAGHARSAEAWLGDRLVGGLYGVAIGPCFFGESMFHLLPDASKCAFAVLARALFAAGCPFIDCQTPSPHFARFGAVPMPRAEYLVRLTDALASSPAIDWGTLLPR